MCRNLSTCVRIYLTTSFTLAYLISCFLQIRTLTRTEGSHKRHAPPAGARRVPEGACVRRPALLGVRGRRQVGAVGARRRFGRREWRRSGERMEPKLCSGRDLQAHFWRREWQWPNFGRGAVALHAARRHRRRRAIVSSTRDSARDGRDGTRLRLRTGGQWRSPNRTLREVRNGSRGPLSHRLVLRVL